ncbi:MAG: 5'-deoxynucleotidase [Lachnospiraceae bacterium]|nr:5'-deoxynucleotidase [Lachnospiraceae bacterium]
MESNFFAMMSRLKYIDRWALMRNTRQENLCEHSLDVAMIAHALAVISNVRCGNSLNADKAAVIGMYHDASEIITGDLPTPIKYYSDDMKAAFKEIEKVADYKIINMLPDDIKKEYESVFFKRENDEYLWKLVKAADKIAAYIKCIEEENTGNSEFKSAKKTVLSAINEIDLEEVRIFMEEFIPAYGKNLDELNKPKRG